MKVTRITSENREYFAPFLPEEGFSEKAVSVGVIADDEFPCGIMVLEQRKNCISIPWIFIHPNYRNQGAGTRLLFEAFACLNGFGEPLMAFFQEDQEDLKRFFIRHGFLLSGADRGYLIPVRSLIRLPEVERLKKFKTMGHNALPVELLSKKQKTALRELLSAAGEQGDFLDNANGAISTCVFDENDRPLACLLAETTENGLIQIDYLLNRGAPSFLSVLFKSLLDKILEFGLEDTFLHFVVVNDDVISFASRLLKDCEGSLEAELLMAIKYL